jgi:hypothetical protein
MPSSASTVAQATVPLRFQWTSGTATFYLTRQDALRAAVALRKLGLGLSFHEGAATRLMITTRTEKFAEAEQILFRLRRGF